MSPGKPKIFNLDLNKTLGLTSGLQETQRQRKSLKQCHKEKKKKQTYLEFGTFLKTAGIFAASRGRKRGEDSRPLTSAPSGGPACPLCHLRKAEWPARVHLYNVLEGSSASRRDSICDYFFFKKKLSNVLEKPQILLKLLS